MTCVFPFLLETPGQIEAFRRKYASLITEHGPSMEEWFNGLPLYEWVAFRCHPGQEAVTAGLLCILYIDGRINLTVSGDGCRIQRGALSDEEYFAWVDAHCGRLPKKRR